MNEMQHMVNSGIKEYLFEFLKTENIKNIDCIENIADYEVINHNEYVKKENYKYINYIPIQLYNPKTKEILTILQQSVSKNTFKIRKSQTSLEFDENLEEFLNKYKGPERDGLMKYKAIEFSNDRKVESLGNYNIPNSVSLNNYLTGMIVDDNKEVLYEKLKVINKTQIGNLDKPEDIMVKTLLGKVVFNKNYRNKLLKQMEYYYYYKDYETSKKLAANVVLVFEWFITANISLVDKLEALYIGQGADEIGDSDNTRDNGESIKKGLKKEVMTIKKLIDKCNQHLYKD